MKADLAKMTLGAICEFRYGKALKAGDRSGDGFPVFGSNGVVGHHSEALTSGPAIIIGRKGSYGEVHLSQGACWPIDTTYYVDESATECDLTWLSYVLPSLRLTELNRAAAIPGLNREDAYRQQLVVPTLNDQRRIARVLSAADALRQSRARALECGAQLIAAVLRRLRHDNRAQTVAVGELVDAGRGGMRTGPFGSQLLHSEFVESGVPVLGIDNVVTNEFRWAKPRYVTKAKYKTLARYTVNPGDVLITIMGTCGRAAVVPMGVPTAINTKHLCCITLNQERCLPDFLHAYFLYDPEARAYLESRAKGAIMSGLNMGIIKELPVRLPDLATQRAFVATANVIRRVQDAQARHASQLDALFASLRHRAVIGVL